MFCQSVWKKIKFLEDELDQLYEEFIDFKTISDLQIDLNQAILKEYENC